MENPKMIWVSENGVGHWKIVLGDNEITCDDNETDIREAVKELKELTA